MNHSIIDKIKERSINGGFYFLVCICGVILLAYALKKWLEVGDEVVAGISAALITLLGVHLTNKNSQKTLDKQLKQQKETFEAQLIDQANSFRDQIEHQNEVLKKQLKHHSEESEKDRKHKIRHETYIELVKKLSDMESFLTSTIFISNQQTEILDKISEINAYVNIAKTVTSNLIMNKLNDLQRNYIKNLKKIILESKLFWELRNKEKSKNEILIKLKQLHSNLLEKSFNDYNLNISEVDSLVKQHNETNRELQEIHDAIALETQRLITLFKQDIDEIKKDTQVIILLINVEQGYNSIDDLR